MGHINEKNLFFEEKQVTSLLNIYEHRKERRYATQIHIETKINYAHLIKETLAAFKKKGLITTAKISRIKYITITKKGERIAKKIIELKKMLNAE